MTILVTGYKMFLCCFWVFNVITQLGSVFQTNYDMQIWTVNLRNSNRKNVQISADLNKEHN